MVEQGTHKPLDVGSNPTLATWYMYGFSIMRPPDMGGCCFVKLMI